MTAQGTRFGKARSLVILVGIVIAGTLLLSLIGLAVLGQTGIILASSRPSLLLKLKIAVSGVESPDGMGTTMLQNAFRYQKAEIAKYLLEEGANVGARDDFGRTLAHYAFMHEAPRAEILLLLGPYLDAALCNTPDDEGATPLHFASFHGDVEGFDFLLEHGCSLCIKTAEGFSLPAYIDDLIGVDSQSKSSYVLELNERRRRIQSRVLELASAPNCSE